MAAIHTFRMRPTDRERPDLPAGSGMRLDRIAAASASVALHVWLIAWWLSGAHSGSGESDQRTGYDGAFAVEFIAVSRPDTLPATRVEIAATQVIASPSQPSDPAENDPIAASESAPSADDPAEPGANPVPEPVDQASTAQDHDGSTGRSLAGEDDLLDRYHAALRARIESMWLSLTDKSLPSDCLLTIHLQAGGALVSASAAQCDLDDADRNQLEAAALMAQPMPYEGFETVFTPELELFVRSATM